jgi:hypothetical protein
MAHHLGGLCPMTQSHQPLRCGAHAARYRFGRAPEHYSITADGKAIGACLKVMRRNVGNFCRRRESVTIAWRSHVVVVLQMGLGAGRDILFRSSCA